MADVEPAAKRARMDNGRALPVVSSSSSSSSAAAAAASTEPLQTAHATNPAGGSAPVRALPSTHDAAYANAFARLREAALVTGVLGGILSFLPVDERLKAGRVSKQWRAAMMQPSLWRDQGWHLTRYVDNADALPLPSWLCASLPVVRCSLDWLLFAHPFARFRQLKNVRHLDLLVTKNKIDIGATAADALRLHLSSLPLQSLRLPLLHVMMEPPDSEYNSDFEALVRERNRRLLSVLTQLESNSHTPSPLASWSAHLTHLRCELYLLPDDPMLTALAAQPWPLLRKLQLTLCCDSSAHCVPAIQQLRRVLFSSSMSALTWLELRVECGMGSNAGCTCTDWWKQLLPSVRTLTNLKLDFSWSGRLHLIELLRLIGADAMPQLAQLCFDCDFLPLSDDERAAAVALLQRMPLTQLIHINPSGHGFSLLHQWSRLSVCTLTGVCCAESVAAVPQLETLSCFAEDIADIAAQWWRRCGCPPLLHAGFVDEQRWQKHLAERISDKTEAAVVDCPAPVVRVLRCAPLGSCRFEIPGYVFPYLAHLPQLRELACCVYSDELRALGLLPQLEKLTLWLADEPEHDAQWTDDAVRTVGELPLQCLHTLRLEGNDEFQEDEVRLSRRHEFLEPFNGDDPDFPWDESVGIDAAALAGEEDAVEMGEVHLRRASFVPLTLEGGLRHLLNLHALASLHLPWVESREVDALRELAQQTGRASLLIERIVPLSRRSLLQRHWMDGDALGGTTMNALD